MAGYAAGVAFGTVLGLTADQRLSTGVSELDIVVPGHGAGTAERLNQLGWPTTTLAACGPRGPVTLICIAVDDTRLKELVGAVRLTNPDAFWTVQPLGRLTPRYSQMVICRLPPDFLVPLAKRWKPSGDMAAGRDEAPPSGGASGTARSLVAGGGFEPPTFGL